jgi:hypothetical protein
VSEIRRMESQLAFASRDDIWRLQESLNEISTIQGQHTERIMRLEKRRDDDARLKSVWGPTSPFPGGLGGSGPQGKPGPKRFSKTLFILTAPPQIQLSIQLLKPFEISTPIRYQG